MEAAELGELQEIHSALERIERGIFGRCDGCAGEIDDATIERMPWQRRCDSCRDDQPPAALSGAAGEQHDTV